MERHGRTWQFLVFVILFFSSITESHLAKGPLVYTFPFGKFDGQQQTAARVFLLLGLPIFLVLSAAVA